MSANVGEGARKLGERLLGEVEVGDLSEVFKAVRVLRVEKNESAGVQTPFFGIQELDTIIQKSNPPMLELISPPAIHHPSGAAKTSLLYLIIAQALLPASLPSSTPLGGQSSAVILFDPLHHFNIHRLAEVTFNLLLTKHQSAHQPLDALAKTTLQTVVSRSLTHLHIFRPQSWPSLLATLRSLPEYLFDASQHKSTHKRIHSIILDDIDTFIASIRSSSSPSNPAVSSNPLSTASTLLTSSLQRLTSLLSCGLILTSTSSSSTSFRAPIPTSWPHNMQIVRLALRRVQVLRFAPAISVEQAEAERQQRWNIVQNGRFECWRVGSDGEGFVFRVWGKGVDVERREVE